MCLVQYVGAVFPALVLLWLVLLSLVPFLALFLGCLRGFYGWCFLVLHFVTVRAVLYPISHFSDMRSESDGVLFCLNFPV